jgi:hypothetical protein
MIRCDLCDATVEDIDAAVEAHWAASYFIGDDQCDPICCDCAATKCRIEDGELVLSEGGLVELRESIATGTR